MIEKSFGFLFFLWSRRGNLLCRNNNRRPMARHVALIKQLLSLSLLSPWDSFFRFPLTLTHAYIDSTYGFNMEAAWSMHLKYFDQVIIDYWSALIGSAAATESSKKKKNSRSISNDANFYTLSFSLEPVIWDHHLIFMFVCQKRSQMFFQSPFNDRFAPANTNIYIEDKKWWKQLPISAHCARSLRNR